MSHNENKAERDIKDIAKEDEEGEAGREKSEKNGEKENKGGKGKGRMVELGQPAVEQLLVGKRLPKQATTLLPSIHRASSV